MLLLDRERGEAAHTISVDGHRTLTSSAPTTAYQRGVGVRNCGRTRLVSPHNDYRHPARHLDHQSPAVNPDPAAQDQALVTWTGRVRQHGRLRTRAATDLLANPWHLVPTGRLVGVGHLDGPGVANTADGDRHPDRTADVQPDTVRRIAVQVLARRGIDAADLCQARAYLAQDPPRAG